MKSTLALAPALALGIMSGVAACTHAADEGFETRDDDGGAVNLDEVTMDGGRGRRTPTTRSLDAGPTDPEANVRYATKVVSFSPGPCAGFGQEDMPNIVLGPPKGAGDETGSFDVLSLGKGGEIILSFEPSAIVDGPGVDFIVFENAFFAGKDPTKPNAELGEVSVSDDGENWSTFPCTAKAAPYGDCAGWHPVYAPSANDPQALDPSTAGGDPFDLATVGLTRARFVRIKDKANQRCTSATGNTNGFDLDAIGAIHTIDP